MFPTRTEFIYDTASTKMALCHTLLSILAWCVLLQSSPASFLREAHAWNYQSIVKGSAERRRIVISWRTSRRRRLFIEMERETDPSRKKEIIVRKLQSSFYQPTAFVRVCAVKLTLGADRPQHSHPTIAPACSQTCPLRIQLTLRAPTAASIDATTAL
jgi:hypothetical protein